MSENALTLGAACNHKMNVKHNAKVNKKSETCT